MYEKLVAQHIHRKPPVIIQSLPLEDVDPAEIPTVISTHSPIELNTITSTSNPIRAVVRESPALQVFKADQVPCGRSSRPTLTHGNSFERRNFLDSNSSISVIPSFLLPTIRPAPRIPLSFLGEENLRVQSSQTDVTNLDMK